jgi:hypothetical protein
MQENNYYEDKKNRQFLDNTPEKNKSAGKTRSEKSEKEESQQEKIKTTLKGVGTDVLVGVVGGGLGAAISGSYSFVAGLMVSSLGHYTKNKYLASLGLGIMASSSMKAAQGVKQDPNAGILTNVTERVKAFGQEFKRKLLLDKFESAKKQNEVKKESNLNGTEQPKENSIVPPPQAFEMINKQIPDNINPQKIDKPLFDENKEKNNVSNKKRYDDDIGLDDISNRIL